MPGLFVFCFTVYPSYHTTIVRGEYLLRFKKSIRIRSKEFSPIGPNCIGTNQSGTIGLWIGILKDAVLRHGVHHGIDIVTIEGGIKPFNCGKGTVFWFMYHICHLILNSEFVSSR